MRENQLQQDKTQVRAINNEQQKQQDMRDYVSKLHKAGYSIDEITLRDDIGSRDQRKDPSQRLPIDLELEKNKRKEPKKYNSNVQNKLIEKTRTRQENILAR